MTIPNIGEDTEKLDLSYIAGGNVKWSSRVGNQFDSLLKKKKKLDMHFPYDPAIALLDIYL